MIRLFVNYYRDKRSERHAEIIECANRNISLNEIDNVYFVCDRKDMVPRGLKHQSLVFDDRPTFTDLFELSNSICTPGDIVIISNSDIFFDETISLANNIKNNECYALSRWDVNSSGLAKPYHRPDSQDVWIFRSAIKTIAGANFHLGKAGCDNRIAYLIERAGYEVTNPCKSIHAFHLHLSGVRNYMVKGKVIERIEPPYKHITPTQL